MLSPFGNDKYLLTKCFPFFRNDKKLSAVCFLLPGLNISEMG